MSPSTVLGARCCVGLLALSLAACGDKPAGPAPASVPASAAASATPAESPAREKPAETQDKVISELPFTLHCAGKSGNKNKDDMPGEFAFTITIDGQQQKFWIHGTEWNWSYWKPLISADNEIRDLRRLDAERIELGVSGVVINRNTGKIGDGDQMQGLCRLIPLEPIPGKVI